jgi:hypothetical protein
MKITAIIALSFGIVTLGASLPAFAESVRFNQNVPKIKVEDLNRRRTTEPKIQQCNIQCITTPCPCTDKITNGKQRNRDNNSNKFDR